MSDDFTGDFAKFYEGMIEKFAGEDGFAEDEIQLAKRVAGGDLLEIGFGTGHAMQRMALAAPTTRFTGIDPSPDFVEQAAGRVPHARLECARVDDMDKLFQPASFDAVTSACVVHFLPSLDAYFAAVARVLRPGGVTHLAAWEAMTTCDEADGHKLYTADDVRNAMAGAGLQMETTRSWNFHDFGTIVTCVGTK